MDLMKDSTELQDGPLMVPGPLVRRILTVDEITKSVELFWIYGWGLVWASKTCHVFCSFLKFSVAVRPFRD